MIRKHDRFTSPGNIILYSDVDGTLVSKSNQIPEKVVRYIQLFIDSGFGFSLATGRSFQSVRRILEKIPVNVPVVLCNGTYVMDTVKNKYWWTSIDKLIIEHILKELSEVPGIWLYLECSDHSFFVTHEEAMQDPFLLQERIQAKHLKSTLEIRNCSDVLKLGIKLLSPHERDRNELCKQLVNMLQDLDTYISCCLSSDNYIEVTPKGVSKWHGIQVSRSMLGHPKNKIYTIGDHHNDIEMIRYADVGIAMENAVEEVKREADFITGHVEDHAILDVLTTIMQFNKRTGIL